MIADTRNAFWDIFEINNTHQFNEKALAMFRFQSKNLSIYKEYLEAIHIVPESINEIKEIPFLPIQFFKKHRVISGMDQTQLVFRSSGTGGDRSRHYIVDKDWYDESYSRQFKKIFGTPSDYEILALLPGYSDRPDSSLIYMVNGLMQQSKGSCQGYYLDDWGLLENAIKSAAKTQRKLMLFGVSFALLDFAQTGKKVEEEMIIVETGGMKGRATELLKDELYAEIKKAFPKAIIYSEYGMTELLSQAYAREDGRFQAPPWMHALIREPEDPFHLKKEGSGALNIIDLANVNSCAFIATDDLAHLEASGEFTVLGRLDNSDLRGCSQLVL